MGVMVVVVEAEEVGEVVVMGEVEVVGRAAVVWEVAMYPRYPLKSLVNCWVLRN